MAAEAAVAVLTALGAVPGATATTPDLVQVLAVVVAEQVATPVRVDLEGAVKVPQVIRATAEAEAEAARLAVDPKMAAVAAESVYLVKVVMALEEHPMVEVEAGALEEAAAALGQAAKVALVDNMAEEVALHPKDPVEAILPALEEVGLFASSGPEQPVHSHQQILRNLRSKNEFIY